ncbi:MAG: polyprenyl synthetase family protein [Clostridia bacterium]|nr:polyprenyl synthetase family protein [Clostridia bacterium]
MNISERNNEYKLLIEAELYNAIASCEAPDPLMSAMKYSISAGGKRLRPCLALGVCDMLGGEREMALALGCGIEMIHTYSLIHDDLPCMDDDDMRRGRPSNHKVFGEGQAVLAGDGLLTFAFELMLKKGLEFNSLAYFKAVHEIAKRAGVSGMVAGQSRDLEAENGSLVDENELRYIHVHKTADMLAAAVLAGAYSADADEASINALEKYSEKMGLLFQITDDILDYEGDQALVGKTLGKDEENSKLTYITLYGIEKARQIAAQTAEDAERIVLDAFGTSAEYLIKTVQEMVSRKY